MMPRGVGSTTWRAVINIVITVGNSYTHLVDIVDALLDTAGHAAKMVRVYFLLSDFRLFVYLFYVILKQFHTYNCIFCLNIHLYVLIQKAYDEF